MLADHIYLKIDNATRAQDIDAFLTSAAAQNRSLGELHLRAFETTHIAESGRLCTVKILFVRSGRANPFEWLINRFNRKDQYALAAKVLRDVGKFEIGISEPQYILDQQVPILETEPKRLDAADAENGITLSSLVRQLPPAAHPQSTASAFGCNNPGGGSKPFMGAGTAESAKTNKTGAWKPSQRLVNSMAYMNYAPVVEARFAEFLEVTTSSKDELDDNFAAFTKLAEQLYKSGKPIEKFPELIKKSRSLTSLLNRAAHFSRQWAICWEKNFDKHAQLDYRQVASIDHFVIWMAKTYLQSQVNCDELVKLSSWGERTHAMPDLMRCDSGKWKDDADKKRAMHSPAGRPRSSRKTQPASTTRLQGA